MRFLDHIANRAKRFLRIAARAGNRSRDHRQRLAFAWARIEEYKRSDDLNYAEKTVLENAFLRELCKPDARPEDCLSNALETCRKFAAEQEQQARDWAQRPALKVSFFDEGEWAPSWIEERRLTILMTPEISESYDGSVTVKDRLFPSGYPNRLDIVARIADFNLDDEWIAAALWIPTIDRTWHWAASKIHLSESGEAVELGMQCYSPKTEISTNIALNCATFDFLKERLDRCSPNTIGAERLVLACGIPVPAGKIPRSRPVTWPEKIADPVSLTAEPRRMSFEIAGLSEASGDGAERRLETFSRWMAVEE